MLSSFFRQVITNSSIYETYKLIFDQDLGSSNSCDCHNFREMVHMAIDGMWQVFKLQKSTSRNDFCRIAAKNGILLRLINTLYSLNEATRLASIASGGAFPPDGLAPRPRSDALDSSSPSFVQMDSSSYGNDQPEHVKVKQGDQMTQTGLQEPSRASVSQSPESRYNPSEVDRPQSSVAMLEASGASRVAEQRSANLANRISTDRAPKSADMISNGFSAHTGSQQENVRPLLSLLDKEPPSRHFSGQLEYVRHLTGVEKHESILPLLHASSDKKTNGLDFLMAEFAGDPYFLFSKRS